MGVFKKVREEGDVYGMMGKKYFVVYFMICYLGWVIFVV